MALNSSSLQCKNHSSCALVIAAKTKGKCRSTKSDTFTEFNAFFHLIYFTTCLEKCCGKQLGRHDVKSIRTLGGCVGGQDVMVYVF